ncbi:beta-N-acetylhexosaminidase [Deinococcus deserti]|uniref:beta-N-acetylhexosaminidase n=1 Tax=Deinococcus deserti (strain DSM 17065 / CIP 109153 / LMG 22923 / VCD115) TaxID=546414 RepID=C1CUP2_DEIDV|nr:beta-N-acetylhexosaminidase [Deinococcus deserti]ACO45909.1 putative Glycoside hydrolase, family 20, precursor [Deinococcus deserti VCD115]
MRIPSRRVPTAVRSPSSHVRGPHLRLLGACLLGSVLLSSATGAQLSVTQVSDARTISAHPSLIPTPQKAEFPAGTLALSGLGLQISGSAPQLGWAARDLRATWQSLLGTGLAEAGRTPIVIGTRADAALAAKARAAGLYTEAPEGYALWVDASGAYVVGADAQGAYYGAQTLAGLLTPQGLRYARIQDAPALKQRVAMLYLDSTSQPVNDRLIPLLARLKFNTVLVMSNYVQWDAAKAGGWAHPGGATKAEAARVARLAREHGLEVIPLLETLGHAGWMFHGGRNRDLVQDPDSQQPYAYDTLNPQTYDRVVFPVLSEMIEVFGPKVIHIGHDEVRNRDRFPARANGKAAGFEKLFVDDTVKIHGFLKARGVGTMMWHDAAFSDSVIATLPARLPKDIQVAYWNYTADANTGMLDRIKALGFPVLGASWYEESNPEDMARAAARSGAAGMIQTRWSGYFGNPSVWDGMAEQGVALVRAGASFWNPAAAPLKDPVSAYRALYQPQRFGQAPGALVNLSPLVTRKLTDADGKGWIGKGAETDLSRLPTGNVMLGGYRFDVSGAVMLRGDRAAARQLPEKVTAELGRKADALVFLHTTGWPAPTNREPIGRYEIKYTDGTTQSVPLEYGRHLRAWTDTLPSSMITAPAWSGQTQNGLDVNVTLLEWPNPKPDLTIQSVTLISAGKGANPTLLGLTLIGSR